MILGLSCRGERTERTAVETVFKRDDAITSLSRSVEPGKFDGCFVSFSSAIAEECLSETASTQKLCKTPLLFGIPRIRNMDEFRNLLLDRFHDRWR